ncbi:uncharacterized protein SCHCODRAFT_01176499 [Schizophyllum commune H4-8]|uniref:Uncharacterized protein n=1 Tax=Schizophyllum commune (strain H4-8 / FGSC 9210) TaxID=578458 RepID=D8QJT6_SCHCM|nr:uncharacterized protein SCHCODRAFT_01176499 [Schizophyllum commune H4-8]KAI5885544.1 hypothetical protein SCHCODRAFT_01176499 [Schizophyllum commune H4-8]
MSPSLPSFFVALALSLILAPTSLAQRKSLPYNFTLAAVNTTLPNTNGTGVPLVLGSAGAVPGASFYITSLRAYDRYGNWHTNATALSSGNEMGWLSTTLGGSESDQFTALHATRHHRYASLAVRASDSPSRHGTDALWSLCPSTQFRGKNEVVYNVSATYQYYPFNVSDCYKVTLQIVPLRWWGDDAEVVDGADGADGDEGDADGAEDVDGGDGDDGAGDGTGAVDGDAASANSTASAIALPSLYLFWNDFICTTEPALVKSQQNAPITGSLLCDTFCYLICINVKRSSASRYNMPITFVFREPRTAKLAATSPFARKVMDSLFLALAVFMAVIPASFAQLKTLPYNFTLAALNTTLPNANDTGVPLVVGSQGGIHGATFYTTRTWASNGWPSQFPSLGLVNGVLRAYNADGTWNTNASMVMSGRSMDWVQSGESWYPDLDQYTALRASSQKTLAAKHHKYASLAAHGHDDLWTLCPSEYDNHVEYNITTDTIYGVIAKDCYKVILQIVPVHH